MRQIIQYRIRKALQKYPPQSVVSSKRAALYVLLHLLALPALLQLLLLLLVSSLLSLLVGLPGRLLRLQHTCRSRSAARASSARV